MTTTQSVSGTTTDDGPLFEPGRIGSMTLRNRFVQAPIFTQFEPSWVCERLRFRPPHPVGRW
ncbi:hypothetical protein ACFFOU_27425, partial [Pseudonocardia sulfidoxydans]|uniref:hypothetical protein n=1 Tax=Pseudonocardia sulfidoxydans TaxID=54011 RepID=UPI0035E76126